MNEERLATKERAARAQPQSHQTVVLTNSGGGSGGGGGLTGVTVTFAPVPTTEKKPRAKRKRTKSPVKAKPVNQGLVSDMFFDDQRQE